MALPPLDRTDGHHVLALPADAVPEVVEILARSRFPRAQWEAADGGPASPGVTAGSAAPGAGTTGPNTTGPTTGPATTTATGPATPGAPSSAFPDAPEAGSVAAPSGTPHALRLSRHSRLIGPFAVDRETAADHGLPPGLAYVLEAPAERGNPPAPWGGDRNGLRRAFPAGLPVRDEERVLMWALDVARRLAGAVRVAERDGSEGVLLTPEPASAVDLTVWSDIWLDPDAAVGLMRQVLPRAALNLPSGRWYGAPTGIADRPTRGAEMLTPEQRAALHSAADEFDRRAMEEPEPMTAYGALADLELDGMIALEISGETTLPPVIGSLPWAVQGAVAYRVRWEPADLEDAEEERPSPMHRVARGRAAPMVAAVARAVHAVVGGEVTDMMEFVVDPADL